MPWIVESPQNYLGPVARKSLQMNHFSFNANIFRVFFHICIDCTVFSIFFLFSTRHFPVNFKLKSRFFQLWNKYFFSWFHHPSGAWMKVEKMQFYSSSFGKKIAFFYRSIQCKSMAKVTEVTVWKIFKITLFNVMPSNCFDLFISHQ